MKRTSGVALRCVPVQSYWKDIFFNSIENTELSQSTLRQHMFPRRLVYTFAVTSYLGDSESAACFGRVKNPNPAQNIDNVC